MPSFAISKSTVLLEPLCVSAEFLLLSTDPLLYIIAAAAAVLYSCRPLLQLYTVFQLCACHPLTSNMTVTERFATSRYYLSHACPCAEWFDAYIAVIVDYTKLRCNYVYVSGTMIFMSGAKSHIVLCIPSGIAEFVIKQFISFQWAYLVIPPL